MRELKTCILRRGISEKMKKFADRTANKIDEMRNCGATIEYAGFVQDRTTKENIAIILYRCTKTFDEDESYEGYCNL